MNIRAIFHGKQHTGRSEAHRCKPQLEALDDRTLPSGLMFGMPNPAVTYAALVAYAKRAMLQAQADLNQAAQARAGQTAEWITVRGTLHTGIMAIGGETTGYQIETADGHVYELQLTRAQQRMANQLDGQQIEVTGRLTMVQGIERPDREVIIVERMRAIL